VSSCGGCPEKRGIDTYEVILVTGGRNFNDREGAYDVLDSLLEEGNGNLLILHGACKTGADAIAQDWAIEREIPYLGVPARWAAAKKSAGPIRNSLLAKFLPISLVVAFPRWKRHRRHGPQS